MKGQRMPGARAMIGVLCGLLAVLGIGLGAQGSRVRALETQVNGTYQKAFYETVELMAGIQVNLEKMMVTASGSQEQALLADIARQADGVQDDLAMLPVALDSISGAFKFVNQLSDFCATLDEKLAAGGAVSEADEETLATLYRYSIELNDMLAEVSSRIDAGENPLAIAQTLAMGVAGGSEPADRLASDDSVRGAELGGGDEATQIDYPELLYDGPFSDGRRTDQLLALAGLSDVDEQYALSAARRFIGEQRVQSLTVTGQGQTPVDVYEMDAVTAEGVLSLAVTKKGGAVLYMILNGQVGAAKRSVADCIDLAGRFLADQGYPAMEVRYWAEYGGIVTANFAPLQDGVVLYPDLVKVQVSMDSGMVVGFEALNYLSSHTVRTDLTPGIGPEEARSLLNARLTVSRERLAIIPADDGEHLCYEFSVSMENANYLIYIDARSGRERKIYRLVEDESGQLVI